MLLKPLMRTALRATALALALSSVACGHWPWHRAPPAAPTPVHELDIDGANAAAFAQYWKRNTLLVDLSSASGSGSITLKPTAGTPWPVRVGFRVSPGTIGVLEVRAAQRTSLPIDSAAGPPVDLELAPGIYTPATKQMTVSWGPQSAPAP